VDWKVAPALGIYSGILCGVSRMIFQLAAKFAADAVEHALPDAAAARELLKQKRPDVLLRLRQRHESWRAHCVRTDQVALGQTENAVLLGVARLGLRHGHFGPDLHAYHNEDHALELLFGRLDRVLDVIEPAQFVLRDALALELFAAGHDLHQREPGVDPSGIGHNELASLAETLRIMDASGFDRTQDADQYLAVAMAIAGSTFDAKSNVSATVEDQGEDDSADPMSSGGALAPRLREWLAREAADREINPLMARALSLACVAADLDTGNVGDAFLLFCEGARRLCEEREMRAGRSLGGVESGKSCIDFLLSGQARYVFDLHRFNSDLGERAFAAIKEENGKRLRALSARFERELLRPDHIGLSGQRVLALYATLAMQCAA